MSLHNTYFFVCLGVDVLLGRACTAYHGQLAQAIVLVLLSAGLDRAAFLARQAVVLGGQPDAGHGWFKQARHIAHLKSELRGSVRWCGLRRLGGLVLFVGPAAVDGRVAGPSSAEEPPRAGVVARVRATAIERSGLRVMQVLKQPQAVPDLGAVCGHGGDDE